MIIRHSLRLLEQLSELETKILQVEKLMEEKGIEIDREQIVLRLLKGQERNSPDH